VELINISNLFYKYHKTDVLENINLSIKDDDFLAIIGPNGGGKSTLLKLILGLLTPQSGTIINNIKTNQVGYVPQNTNLNIDFPITALEIVLMGHVSSQKKLFGYSKEDIACAMASLAKVSMTDFANSKIGDLSGGQRQRVFIARALCSNPKIMLLDEPTASIDVKGQREIYELLKEINNSICVVVVSHDISVLLNYAKNVAHINKNLVYHSLENVEKNVNTQNEHLCEVELLSALGKTHICCEHTH
jgi:zinc transport system ATP-binding protein